MHKNIFKGLILCLILGFLCFELGNFFPIIGGPVFAILLGMIINPFIKGDDLKPGISFSSKKLLQLAVVFLGFGLDLKEVIKVGQSSILIIISTIITALVLSFIVHRLLKLNPETSILIGVGSSICGGSAIAATSSVIKAKDENIATAISVIFLFNVIAAIIFPIAGEYLKLSDHGFGMWAGTAINDTSSVVAAGQIWATRTGSDVALNYATIVKLTRTLAIIPITLILGMYYSKKEGYSESKKTTIIPLFILLFLLASLISSTIDIPSNIISTLKNLSKYFICVAMAAIGMNTHLNHLVKKGGKTIIQGLVAWVGIIFVSLFIQKLLNMW